MKSPSCGAVVLLLATGFGCAASLAPAAEQVGESPPVAAAPDSEQVVYAAPTRIDAVGRVLAEVRINGAGPFRFIVDTGANRSALSPRLVEKLRLPMTVGDQVRLTGVTGSALVPLVQVQLLQAGDLKLHDQRFPVIEPHVFAGADGILGIEGFADKRLDIDFRRNRVSITRSRGAAAPSGYYTVPVRRRAGLLVAQAQVGPIGARAIIDTGAERSLGNGALRQRLERRRLTNLAGRADNSTTIYGATADVLDGESLLAPKITIGDAELTNLEVTFGNLYLFRAWNLEHVPAVLLGMDLLGTAEHLIIDYRRNELQIKAAATPRPGRRGAT
jgi:hypothetical protein